jgi:hypothetical protein
MTNGTYDRTERRIRLAAALLLIGLGIEFVTLLINRPLSFLAFIGIGSPFVVAGALVYLWAIVVHSEPRNSA